MKIEIKLADNLLINNWSILWPSICSMWERKRSLERFLDSLNLAKRELLWISMNILRNSSTRRWPKNLPEYGKHQPKEKKSRVWLKVKLLTCHVKVSLKMESISTWESVRLSMPSAVWTKVSKVRNLVLRNHRLLRRGRRRTFSDLLFLYFFVFIHNKYQISHHYAKPLNGEPTLCLASHQRCLRAALKEEGKEVN